MGRKGSWFSTVKKALSPDPKEKKNQDSNRSKKKWFGKEKLSGSDSTPLETVTAPAPPQREEVKLTCVENGENNFACSVEVASTAAADTSAVEADTSATQTETEAVQLTTVARFSGKSKEEVAAIKIQTAFRGYLARRALRALRGLVRLKTLMESSVVKRQAANTLRCMQTLSRVQSQIRFRRIRMLEENQALQKQLLQKHAKELENLRIGEEWDDSLQSKEQIEANLLSKYEAAMRRERALAYAFSHQKNMKNSSRFVNPMFMDPSNPTWGWSWLERWMAARPWEGRGMTEKELNNENSSVKSIRRGISGGEISKSYTRYQLNTEVNSPTASQKANDLNVDSPMTPSKPALASGGKKLKSQSPRSSWVVPDDDSKSIASMQSDRLRRHSIGGSSVRDDESMASSPAVPSYMTPTKSARAKSKLQSPLGMEKIETPPEKGSSGSTKKRLSYPPSPALARRHSGPPKMETSLNAENSIGNGAAA